MPCCGLHPVKSSRSHPGPFSGIFTPWIDLQRIKLVTELIRFRQTLPLDVWTSGGQPRIGPPSGLPRTHPEQVAAQPKPVPGGRAIKPFWRPARPDPLSGVLAYEPDPPQSHQGRSRRRWYELDRPVPPGFRAEL
ncbi:hypothetical protein BOSEA31B_13916 [Hyphomicrobiales bacterium]|nr:hypothetical protein BOSEA31B_13916 [Hyphomicrobiales bacterium]CAH1699692.1 hypothetical protein BOSEA1005_12745 [Hyphomicrobiales bacterium]CAI0343423.1 hypothetical protein BO1005MUT1_270032 [Hyphomicrobiales bacterium]